MKQYLINNYTYGLDLKIKHIKFLASKNIAKIFDKKYDIFLDEYKELFLEHINFTEGYFKILEKNKREQLCLTPVSDLEEQFLVLFVSFNPQQHKAYYINIRDTELRSNKYVIDSLKNHSQFSVVEVDDKNLNNVTISYDLKTRRENLVATYKIPGGTIPFYIHKLH